MSGVTPYPRPALEGLGLGHDLAGLRDPMSVGIFGEGRGEEQDPAGLRDPMSVGIFGEGRGEEQDP